MKNLGMTIDVDPKGDTITCPAFGLYSSPVEYSTMGHIVLGLTSLAYQPRLRERSTHLQRHVTLPLTEQKSAYPGHTREVDEDEDDQPLVQPTSIKKSQWKKSMNLLQDAEFLHKYEEEKDLQLGKTHLPRSNKMCQETRVSGQKKSRFCAASQTVKLFATL